MENDTLIDFNFTSPKNLSQNQSEGFETIHEINSNINVYYLILNGYLMTLLSIFGIVGNVASILVFAQKHMRKTSINVLLIGLQVSDLLVVIAGWMFFGIAYLSRHLSIPYGNTSLENIVDYMCIVFGTSGKLASHTFTILITLERYVAVCHPLKVPVWCSVKRAKVACVAATIFSIVCMLPYWLDPFSMHKEQRNAGGSGSGYFLEFTAPVTRTQFDYLFSAYLVPVVLYVVPFVIVIVFNILIYRQFRRSSVQRKTMTNQTPSDADRYLSLILFSIVITFLLSNSFMLISRLQHFTCLTADVVTCNKKRSYYAEMKNIIQPYRRLFTAINSSSNFIFYCAFGKKFRDELKKIVSFKRFIFWNRRETTASESKTVSARGT